MNILAILSVISLLLIVFYSWYLGISPMPTAYKPKAELLKLLPHHVQGKIFELGSGWGTLARPLAATYEKNSVMAYELSPLPYLISWIVNKICPKHNLCFERVDFFERDLTDAGLVVCYLYPGAMARLKSKFDKELKPGTWVISNTFAVPGWHPFKTVEVADLYHTKIYVYRL